MSESRVVDAELVGQDAGLGLGGQFLAGLTVLAAGSAVLLWLFGKVLILSAAVSLIWPMVFSPDFTAWVFGEPTVSFWKILLLMFLAGTAARWFRRRTF